MDQYLSAIIVAIITGVFSTIAIILNKKTNEINAKINDKNVFDDKEKALKKKLNLKEKERDRKIHEIMILVLDTNMEILRNTATSSDNPIDIDRLDQLSIQLKREYQADNMEIDEIRQEYEIMLNVAQQFQQEIEKLNSSKNNTN